jgi:hypothetical protein
MPPVLSARPPVLAGEFEPSLEQPEELATTSNAAAKHTSLLRARRPRRLSTEVETASRNFGFGIFQG